MARLLTRATVLLMAALLGMASPVAWAQPPGSQVSGTVESVAENSVILVGGERLALSEQPGVTLVTAATMADLAVGQFVAIAAQRGPDGVLEASVVSRFPEGSTTARGQRPMAVPWPGLPLPPGENVMTNADIDEARLEGMEGAQLTISFEGETGQVRITPATRIEFRSVGSMANVVPGARVTGFVNPSGVAGGVWVHLD